jgi:RNA polymerase sigma factor (sigma-70 family)
VDDLFCAGQIAWWLQRPNYDAKRGASRETYLKRVVRHAFADVFKAERALARQADFQSESFFAPLTPESELTPEDISPTPDEFAHLAFEMDVRELMERLTPRQRYVVQGRQDGDSMAALARQLGVHRDTLYQDLQQIQRVFRAAGLFNPTDLPPASHRASGGSS